MARGNAISWSQTETDNLLPWLSRNRHLSWEGKSRAYFLQNRVVRSIESLRGKKYQLLRKRHEQQRLSVRSGTKKRRRQYLLRRKSRELPESPPILRLGSSDQELWQMIQCLQTSLEACSLHSRFTDSCDGKSPYCPFMTMTYLTRRIAGDCSFRVRSPVPVSLGPHKPVSCGGN
jgi:hypothetical protein